ncbi:MAG: ABC transporter permease [Armatimonadota bacterium]|nr:ABC transporter permease [Armatimonadota bacterium]MDR7475999.1 ABC transporter permease [Armatimonadota bacterium]MDR7538318.1 ABC transporter permease [Armatimonadota bacterium]
MSVDLARTGSASASPAWMPLRRRSAIFRLLHHRSFLFGVVILTWLAAVLVLGPAMAPVNPLAIDPINRLQPPSRAHWFGTDHLGRDIFSRVLYGARYSMAVAVGAILAGGFIGWFVGSFGGYATGRPAIVLGGLIDIFLAFPMELIALAMVSITGAGLQNVILAISLSIWPRIARVVRGEVLRLRELEFVEAARALGAQTVRIMLRHILPNVLAPMIVALTFYVGSAVLVEAALSFLGLGVPPPIPTWGNIASDARKYLVTSPWGMLFSGIAVGLTVLSLNLLGDGLRDYFDPRLRGR